MRTLIQKSVVVAHAKKNVFRITQQSHYTQALDTNKIHVNHSVW